jgi:hypothetical protein
VAEQKPQDRQLVELYDENRQRTPGNFWTPFVWIGNISGVLADVNRLLDDSIAADRIDKGEQGQQRGVIDLAKIDFDLRSLEKVRKIKTKNVELDRP